ncbi:MAG: hypothetical protein AAB874_04215 [Patescibacteria group bacterium]
MINYEAGTAPSEAMLQHLGSLIAKHRQDYIALKFVRLRRTTALGLAPEQVYHEDIAQTGGLNLPYFKADKTHGCTDAGEILVPKSNRVFLTGSSSQLVFIHPDHPDDPKMKQSPEDRTQTAIMLQPLFSAWVKNPDLVITIFEAY